MESLAVCHLQDEPYWPAARTVAQQDIDAYLREAGPQLADRRQAMDQLAAEFARKFPDETEDPVLIRSYMRRIIRRIDYDLLEKAESVPQAASAPATVPAVENAEMATESEVPMTEQQRMDIARLCHEANVPDKSGEQLTAKAAQQVINELREKAAEIARK
jgi:hypothetical protein